MITFLAYADLGCGGHRKEEMVDAIPAEIGQQTPQS
jgi:hypothetical protein